MKRLLTAVAIALAVSTTASGAERGGAPFVVKYRCDGDRWIAVGYPAYRDARKAPIRIAWRGKTVELAPARAGSGARYVNALAHLEWWSKGATGTLNDLRTGRALLSGCSEA